jgi:hypothetical protein
MSISNLIWKPLYMDRKHAILRVVLPFISVLLFQPKLTARQTPFATPARQQEVVGRLSGDDVSVTGALRYENDNGRTTALLASGSDLTLRSGQARVDLSEGGAIILCGPAHLSLLKSGPAITIALDYGQVHLQVDRNAQVIIYSPLLVVIPEAIGDRRRDLTIGLDQKGELCVMALSGAMRIEEQFTGESVIVPQGGNIQVEGGELRSLHSGTRKCSCELLVSGNGAQRQIEANAAAQPSPGGAVTAREPELTDTAIYRIDMPLTFDASSAAFAPALSSEAILLIRDSVADPTVSFRGAIRPALPPPTAEVSRSIPQARHSRLGLFARFFGIFHHRSRPPASEQSSAARP